MVVTSPRRPILQLQGISKTYANAAAPALQGIDLKVLPGEVFGIIGHSGAGKSSLLRLLNRLESPSGGHVEFDGQDIGTLEGAALRALRRRIGMIFQHFNLIGVKTVWQNVALPLLLAGIRGEEVDRKVREALDLVGLQDKHGAYPSQLSGGQKQRVGIARALVNRPDVLLCDEATSALDPQTTQSILQLLRDINARTGLTIVLITHEMSVVRAICDRVLVLDHGCIAETGPVWEVFGSPGHEATRNLLEEGSALLPIELRKQLSLTATHPSQEVLLHLHFSGQGALEPDLSVLVQALGAGSRLRHACMECIQGRTLGDLFISAPGELAPDTLLQRMHGLACSTSIVGYLRAGSAPHHPLSS